MGLEKVADEFDGAEYWHRPVAARAAASRRLNMSAVEDCFTWRS
jgi:hypothetical protein